MELWVEESILGRYSDSSWEVLWANGKRREVGGAADW